jgi:hypothetical protein
LLLSTLLHVWIAHATVWEVMNSKLQFLLWPGLATTMLVQSVLPASVTLQRDPLPHPVVLWAALAINVLVWAAIFAGAAALVRAALRRGAGRAATVILAFLISACSAEQAYYAGQTWQQNECNKIPDSHERERCLGRAGGSYESYKRQTEEMQR